MVLTTLAGPRASTPGGTSHDEEALMVPPADEQPASLELVVYQLGELKRARADDRRAIHDELAALKAEMRNRFDSLGMLRKDTFDDYKAAVAERDRETREIATSARTLAQASLWVLIVAVVSGIVALAFQVAA
jgi:hypothetical protein